MRYIVNSQGEVETCDAMLQYSGATPKEAVDLAMKRWKAEVSSLEHRLTEAKFQCERLGHLWHKVRADERAAEVTAELSAIL